MYKSYIKKEKPKSDYCLQILYYSWINTSDSIQKALAVYYILSTNGCHVFVTVLLSAVASVAISHSCSN